MEVNNESFICKQFCDRVEIRDFLYWRNFRDRGHCRLLLGICFLGGVPEDVIIARKLFFCPRRPPASPGVPRRLSGGMRGAQREE